MPEPCLSTSKVFELEARVGSYGRGGSEDGSTKWTYPTPHL